jgi:apolipoprotein N-acyltransferase
MQNTITATRPEAAPAPVSQPVSRPTAHPMGLLAAAVGTALLLYLCHFPVAWGWLGWVALVPLLSLVRSEARPWRIYLTAWASGLLFFVPVLQWMRVADAAMYATWALLAFWCSLSFPAGIWLVRRLDRQGWPLVLSVPVAWVALEFFRGTFLGGFPWYFLGHTQHAFLPVIQVADLGGVYAVTFLVAAVNALVFGWLCRSELFRRVFGLPAGAAHPGWMPLPMQSAAVVLLVAADLGYGFWQLGRDQFETGPRVALLQGSVPQSIKNIIYDDKSPEAKLAGGTLAGHYVCLADVAVRLPDRPDLVVWPETCFPDDWEAVSPDVPPAQVSEDWAKRARDTATVKEQWHGWWPTNVLLGMDSRILEADLQAHRYNSSHLVRADGSYGGRYDKIHLVPFGEYLPLEWVPGMQLLSPYDFPYSVTPGKEQTRFEMGRWHFGMVICYEDSDPYLARQYQRRTGPDAGVDFLVNTSNDGWFMGTSEHEEHLAVARFRAVECRRSLVRAVNMGISAVIDPDGRVLAPEEVGRVRWKVRIVGSEHEEMTVPVWAVRDQAGPAAELPLTRWGEFKSCYGVLTATVPIDHRASLYAAWGDWLPWGCWASLAVAGTWGLARGRARRPGRTTVPSFTDTAATLGN